MRATTSPLTIAQIMEAAPAVFQDAPNPDRTSDRYVHISTQPVLEAMNAAGYGVSRAQQTHSRDKDNLGYARHLLAFRPLEAFTTSKVGDGIPEVILINSHDGGCSYKLHVGLFRLVCSNGMVAGDTFHHVKITHRGVTPTQVVEESAVVFEKYVPKLVDWVQRAETTKLSKRKALMFAQEAAAVRYGEVPPFDPVALLDVRRPQDEGDSMWHIFNRVQENLMKGGLEYRSAAGRSMKAKPIERVTKDVMFNQRLWDVADSYLEAAVDAVSNR